MSETYDIAIRIDATDPTPLKQFLAGDGGAYLVVSEYTDGNPHFHAVLHSRRKLPAVRQALKRAMPDLNGNGSYSVTAVRDLAKYQRYMMKGESREVMPTVVAANGWSYQDASWQEEQHDAYWDENDLMTRKRKAEPVLVVVLHKLKEQKVSWNSRSTIAEVYLREVAQRGKPINLFAAKSAVNLLQVQLCPDDRALEDLAAQV